MNIYEKAYGLAKENLAKCNLEMPCNEEMLRRSAALDPRHVYEAEWADLPDDKAALEYAYYRLLRRRIMPEEYAGYAGLDPAAQVAQILRSLEFADNRTVYHYLDGRTTKGHRLYMHIHHVVRPLVPDALAKKVKRLLGRS